MDIEAQLKRHFLGSRIRATARHHDMAGKPYRPSTGSEGADFQARWCDLCSRDKAFREDPDFGESCPIVADTFAFDIADPRYPKEWIHDRDGRPSCTAFTTDPAKPPRCDKTLDMFEPER